MGIYMKLHVYPLGVYPFSLSLSLFLTNIPVYVHSSSRRNTGEIRDGNVALVDYGDLQQEVRIDLVDVKVGEFVLVHVGFAIQRLSREEGLETRELFKEVYKAMEEGPESHA